MSLLNIRIVGDPILRRKAKEVMEFGEELETLASNMVETMLENDGIGLAAPQVGILKRFIVIGLPVSEDSETRKIFTLANPVVLERSEEKEVLEEGCLSIPEITEEVERAVQIRVQFQDLEGNYQEMTTEKVLARVIQHEVDHLDGVLFIDHLSPLRRTLLRGKIKRLQQDQAQTAREA